MNKCVFCKRKVLQGGNGNDILHHTFPRCLVKRSWIENKDVPNKDKELLIKSRTSICSRCHKVYHNITRHLVQLIKDSEVPDTPPTEFMHIFRSIDEKFAV